jgi:pyruvate/2-oxoglutarate dehydrogenase complex dihydrolipoamide acyltransferase (E2) component
VKPVLVPTTDVNSDTALLLAWHAADRSEVQPGETIAEIETSKAIIDVPAPSGGFLLHAAREGAEVRLSEPVARLFDDERSLESYVEQDRQGVAGQAEDGPRRLRHLRASCQARCLGCRLYLGSRWSARVSARRR